MCDVRRINKLKRKAKSFSDQLQAINLQKLYSLQHVTETGLTYTDITDRLNKIKGCSSIIELKSDFVKSGETLEQVMSVSAANFCKQPIICPICADRTQSRRHVRFDAPIKRQAARVAAGERFAYIVTQTVTDGPDLSERLQKLKDSKKAFRLMGQRRRKGRSIGEAGKYVAAIAGIEIKRGSGSGLWHVHSHELVFTKKPIDFKVYDPEKKSALRSRYGKDIPKEKLNEIAISQVEFRGELVAASKASTEWHRATGGESIGIEINAIRHVPQGAKGKKKRRYEKMSFEESVAYQAKEVLKYPFKWPDNHPEDALEVISETYNKRMVATYGEFRGIPAEEYDNAVGDDDETFVLKWNDESGRYGEPVPGTLLDVIENEDIATTTRKKVGELLGKYRRQRKELCEAREQYKDSLSAALDSAKRYFRQQINAIWSIYRQHVNASKRMDSAGCDKYSAVMSLDGFYSPDSDGRDIYAAVFT